MHILKFNDIKEALSGIKHCTGVQVKQFLNEYIEKKYNVSNVISLTSLYRWFNDYGLTNTKKGHNIDEIYNALNDHIININNALINKLKKNGITVTDLISELNLLKNKVKDAQKKKFDWFNAYTNNFIIDQRKYSANEMDKFAFDSQIASEFEKRYDEKLRELKLNVIFKTALGYNYKGFKLDESKLQNDIYEIITRSYFDDLTSYISDIKDKLKTGKRLKKHDKDLLDLLKRIEEMNPEDYLTKEKNNFFEDE